MQTSGPRRYSKFELCSTRQLQNLAEEFCYDVETLRKIHAVLEARTCRHSAHVNRAVKRQLKALTSGPPPRSRMPWGRQHVFSAGLALVLAVFVAIAVDSATRWLLLG